jgi:hypothetical protein
VTLTLNLSEAVTVTGGSPTLSLNDGGTATYTGGNGSNAITFSYTVAAGQNTSALAVTAINLNDATITDLAGNGADLSLTGLTQSGPHINAAAPPAPVIAHDSVHGNHVTLTGVAEAQNTVSVYDGQTFLGSTTANAHGAWSYTTGSLTTGAHTFVATATDAAGNTSSSSTPLDPFIGQIAPPTILSPAVGNGATRHADKLIPTGAVDPDNAVAIHHDSVDLGTTTVNNLALTGAAEPDSTVTIFDRHVELGTTTADSTGSWNYTTGVLSDGHHRFTTTDTIAGSTSPRSNVLEVRIAAAKTSHGDQTNTSAGHDGQAKLIDPTTLDDIFGTSSKSNHASAQDLALHSKSHDDGSANMSASVPTSDSSVLESPTLHSGANNALKNTSTSEVTSNVPNDSSTSPQWHIDISKLRDMIASLQSAHKSNLASDAHLSDSSTTVLNSGSDAFSFNANLTEEILKHPHSAAESAEIGQQLDAVYAQLRAEFQTTNADNALAIASEGTAASHDVGAHLHLHGLHLG